MSITILVIDDSEDDQCLYRRAFEDFDNLFDLVMASSAEAGLSRLADSNPKLILLDYNLPDMDGLSLIKKLAAYSDTLIPIIMLSGEANTAVAVEAMKNGVDDYIIKDTDGRYLRLLPGVAGRVLAAHAQREESKLLRRKADALLLRNQVLMHNSMDGIHVLDTEGNVLEANDTFCRMLGYTREEMARLNVADWAAEFSGDELRAQLKSRIGKNTMIETVNRRKDGSLIHVEIGISGRMIDGQELIFCSSRDISERKRSETNLRAMLDNAPYMSWLKDPESRYIAVNKVFANYLRLENSSRIIGKTDLDLWPEELAKKYRADDADVMAERQQKHFEERVLDGDKMLWVETFKAPIVDALGNLLGTVGIAQDITERKGAEEELRRENESGRKYAEMLAQQFGHLLQSSFNEIYMFDADSLQFILTSAGAEKNLGYSDEELNQLTPLDLKQSYTRESFESLIAPLRSGEQQMLLFETSHLRKDGTVYPVEVRLQLMRAQPSVFLAIVQDITERKASEERLHFHSTILKNLSEGVVLIRASDGVIVFTNAQFEHLFGYESGELFGKHISIVNSPDENSPEEVANAIMGELARSGAWSGEVRNIKKDGTVFWCQANVSTFEHSQFGKVWVSVHEDITERKQRDQTLQKFESIIDSTDDAIISLTLDGIIQSWNQGAERIFGYATTEIVGKRMTVLIPSERFDEAAEILAQLSRGEAVDHLETVHQRKDGKLINISATISPIFGARGQVVGVSEIARDITERKLAEQQARELSAHLHTVREEEKASFAREVHDDLGGTLTALKMDAYWLAGKLAEDKKMAPLEECAKSMIGLIDTAVIATRRIITDLRPTLLDDLGLLEALKWQSAQFKKRSGIECRVVGVEDKKLEERLDKAQLINLFRIAQEALTNVARHSDASQVEIDLHQDGEEAVLSISDNGCGLPQGHTIASSSYGIRGIRERVEQLSGKIKFDTAPGCGFSVTVKLPLLAENLE